MGDTRQQDAVQIKLAYGDVELALGRVGKLLRTTYAGKFMWSADHKTAVSGLKTIVEHLRREVPDYRGGA